MADAPNAKSLSMSDADKRGVETLRKRYLCPHFRILVIGRANAGKTTILEKVCGVARGTKPIIYDKDGKELVTSLRQATQHKTQSLVDTTDNVR
ncbi:hypothetical protein F5887DRAFT_1283135 [Amanita rubescens]|nr:hypothetical protein F5887DRAFT_1283135 [Amanita rubescens]